MSVPDDPFGSLPPPRTSTRDQSPDSSIQPTNPPSIHTPSYGLTVPAGTAATASGSTSGAVTGTGAKTPRRVQWNSHIVNVPSVEQREAAQPIARPRQGAVPAAAVVHDDDDDRHSLNARGLAHLTNELERHQSLSREQRNKPKFVIGGDDRDHDEELSLDGSEGGEDYDYRLDTDGEGKKKRYGGGRRSVSVGSSGASSAVSDETEYDRTPAREREETGDRAGSMGDLEKTLSNGKKIDVNTAGGEVHPSAALPPPQALIPEENYEMEPDIRDEMPVFVDPGETDGLPTLPPDHDSAQAGVRQYNEAEQMGAEASALVKAHKSGRFGNFLRNRKTGFQKGFNGVSNGVNGVATGVGGVATGVGRGAAGVVTGVGKGAMGVANGVAGTVTGRGRQGGINGAGIQGMGLGGRPGMGAGAVAGGGVLASLLTLYDNGQNNPSGQSTPASSRAPSLMPSEDSSDSEEERERERKWRKKREREDRARLEKEMRRLKKENDAKNRRSYTENMPGRVRSPLHSTVGASLQQRRKHAVSDPPAPEGDFAGTGENSDLTVPNAPFAAEHRSQSHNSLSASGRQSPRFMQSVKRAADRLGLDVDDYDRPKGAKSGAGVFGALIQGAGSLTGAATPAGASLTANAKRPGYRLSRYSVGDGPRESGDHSRPTSLYERSETPQSATRVNTDESPTSQTQMMPSSNALNRPATTDNRTRPTAIELPPRTRSGKPFSIKSFTDLTHLPLTPGSHFKNFMSGKGSQPGTPPSEYGDRGSDYFTEKPTKWQLEDDRKREKWEAEKKKRKKAKEKKKQQEIFIIQHVAAILARQQFLMKLIRAFMM
jgi:hypothetical protein